MYDAEQWDLLGERVAQLVDCTPIKRSFVG